MAKRKPDEPKKGAPEWQCTFSDLMNLLLCFFVLLFSMSSVDASKWEQVVLSMSSAFSIFDTGSMTIGEGSIVGVGTTQLETLDEYYSSLGQQSEEDGESDLKESGTKQDIKEKISETRTETEVSDGKPLVELLEALGVDEAIIDQMSRTGIVSVELLKDMYADGELDESMLKLLAALGMLDQETLEKLLQSDLYDQLKADGVMDEKLLEQLKALADMADGTTVTEESAADLLAQAGKLETEMMYDQISGITEIYDIEDQIGLSMDEEGTFVELTISGSLLFDSGSATLKDECKPLLAKVGDIINMYEDNFIDVVGHTDNVPINSSTYSSNEILSSARAISAAQYIVKNNGIDIHRVGWTGRGEYEPVDTNDTPEGRAKNRRVEIRIYNSYNSK